MCEYLTNTLKSKKYWIIVAGIIIVSILTLIFNMQLFNLPISNFGYVDFFYFSFMKSTFVFGNLYPIIPCLAAQWIIFKNDCCNKKENILKRVFSAGIAGGLCFPLAQFIMLFTFYLLSPRTSIIFAGMGPLTNLLQYSPLVYCLVFITHIFYRKYGLFNFKFQFFNS